MAKSETNLETFKMRFNVSHGRFIPMNPHDEPFSTQALKNRLTREDMPVWYSDHPLMYMSMDEKIEWHAQQDVIRARGYEPHIVYRPTKIEELHDKIKAREGFENWSLIRLMYDDVYAFWGARLAPDCMSRRHKVNHVDGSSMMWRDELSWDLGTLKAFKNYGTLHVTYEEPAEYSERWG